MYEQERAFYQNNRKKLRQFLVADKKFAELIVVGGNSFMQASADRAFPFEQDSNFFYLTGITEPEVILVMDSDSEYLIVPGHSESRIAFEGDINRAHMSKISGIETILTDSEGWGRLSKQLIEIKRVSTLLASENYIPSLEMFTNPTRQRLVGRMIEQEKSLQLYDLRASFIYLRMVKSDYEIEMIHQAIKDTIDLFVAIEENRTQAVHEHDLLAEITRLTVQKQLVNAYDPIIASGENSLTLHYDKNNGKLDKNGLLLLDIGLKYRGYAADISRTVSYKPTKRQQAVYDAVLDVQSYAISLLKPGVYIKEYEAQVRQYMGEQLQELGLITNNDKESIGKFYPHSTSHFLGLDVHDTGDYQRPLEPGMVLTVEPGIYINEEKIGIRLEDDIVITKEGNEILSDALPKTLGSLTIQ